MLTRGIPSLCRSAQLNVGADVEKPERAHQPENDDEDDNDADDLQKRLVHRNHADEVEADTDENEDDDQTNEAHREVPPRSTLGHLPLACAKTFDTVQVDPQAATSRFARLIEM